MNLPDRIKQFKPHDWLLVGGGAVVFLFGFFNWFDTDPASSSAFKFTLTGVIPWLLIVTSALLAFQIRTGYLEARKLPWPTIFLLATAIGTILILVRVIKGAGAGDFGASGEEIATAREAGVATSSGRKFSLWVSFAGSIVATAGAGLGFVAAGGTVDDLPFVKAARTTIADVQAKRRAQTAAKDTGDDEEVPPAPPRDRESRRLPPSEQDRPMDPPQKPKPFEDPGL